MIKVKVVYSMDNKKVQKTYNIDYERFQKVFKMIDAPNPMWSEFSFFLLEDFWRDTMNNKTKNYKIYYDGRPQPTAKDWEALEIKAFLIEVLRDSKLKNLIT